MTSSVVQGHICWFGAQETFIIIIIKVEKSFRILPWIESSKEQHLFEKKTLMCFTLFSCSSSSFKFVKELILILKVLSTKKWVRCWLCNHRQIHWVNRFLAFSHTVTQPFSLSPIPHQGKLSWQHKVLNPACNTSWTCSPNRFMNSLQYTMSKDVQKNKIREGGGGGGGWCRGWYENWDKLYLFKMLSKSPIPFMSICWIFGKFDYAFS